MLLAPLVLAALAAVGPPMRVLVLDVAGETLTREERGAIRDRLAAEAARRKHVEVISAEDMRQVLDVEAQRQAAGCEGKSDCLAEIGAALGADRVLYASVAKVGSEYVVNMALVDPKDARSLGRDTFQAESIEEAARQIPDAANRLFGEVPAAATGGAPVITITGGVIAGVGAAAAVGLGIATLLAADTVADPKADGAAKQDALARGPLYLTATGISAGVCGAGLILTVLGLIVE